MGNCLKKKKKSSKKGDDESPKAALGGRNVTLITSIGKWEEKLSEANRDNKIVVVNFSASWCTPCRVISPAFADLADKYSSMMFLTVDVDELAEFSTSWDIKATPAFFFLKMDEKLTKLWGQTRKSSRGRQQPLPIL